MFEWDRSLVLIRDSTPVQQIGHCSIGAKGNTNVMACACNEKPCQLFFFSSPNGAEYRLETKGWDIPELNPIITYREHSMLKYLNLRSCMIVWHMLDNCFITRFLSTTKAYTHSKFPYWIIHNVWLIKVFRFQKWK